MSRILIFTKKQTSPNKSLNKSEDWFCTIMLSNPHTKTTIDSSEFFDPWVCRWLKESYCQIFPDNWPAWTFSHMVGRISKWISSTRFVRSWHFWVFFFMTFSGKSIDLHLDLDYQRRTNKVNDNSLPSANCLIFVPLEKTKNSMKVSKTLEQQKCFEFKQPTIKCFQISTCQKKSTQRQKNIVFYLKKNVWKYNCGTDILKALHFRKLIWH